MSELRGSDSNTCVAICVPFLQPQQFIALANCLRASTLRWVDGPIVPARNIPKAWLDNPIPTTDMRNVRRVGGFL